MLDAVSVLFVGVVALAVAAVGAAIACAVTDYRTAQRHRATVTASVQCEIPRVDLDDLFAPGTYRLVSVVCCVRCEQPLVINHDSDGRARPGESHRATDVLAETRAALRRGGWSDLYRNKWLCPTCFGDVTGMLQAEMGEL